MRRKLLLTNQHGTNSFYPLLLVREKIIPHTSPQTTVTALLAYARVRGIQLDYLLPCDSINCQQNNDPSIIEYKSQTSKSCLDAILLHILLIE